jgi:hypothetical protein
LILWEYSIFREMAFVYRAERKMLLPKQEAAEAASSSRKESPVIGVSVGVKKPTMQLKRLHVSKSVKLIKVPTPGPGHYDPTQTQTLQQEHSSLSKEPRF